MLIEKVKKFTIQLECYIGCNELVYYLSLHMVRRTPDEITDQALYKNLVALNWTEYSVENSTIGSSSFLFIQSFSQKFVPPVFYLFGPLDSVYRTS